MSKPKKGKNVTTKATRVSRNKNKVKQSQIKQSQVKQKTRMATKKEKEKKIKQRKRRIRLFNVFLSLLGIAFLGVVIYLLLQVPIQSIIVKGNIYLSDQEVIDMAGIREYPKTIPTSSIKIEKNLIQNDLILKATVKKGDFLRKVVITVEENKPLFYYQPDDLVVLQDGTKIEGNFRVPIVLNQIPEDVYKRFLKNMVSVPNDVLIKISEIRYYPTDVDAELFLMAMNDGNYVYVTLPKFERIYDYLEYAEGLGNKKGILHLDSGEYVEVLEGK